MQYRKQPGNAKRNRRISSNLRENESVTVSPLGVLGVEVHESVEENMGSRSTAHRGTGVTRVGLGRGIDLEGMLAGGGKKERREMKMKH